MVLCSTLLETRGIISWFKLTQVELFQEIYLFIKIHIVCFVCWCVFTFHAWCSFATTTHDTTQFMYYVSYSLYYFAVVCIFWCVLVHLIGLLPKMPNVSNGQFEPLVVTYFFVTCPPYRCSIGGLSVPHILVCCTTTKVLLFFLHAIPTFLLLVFWLYWLY